MGAAISGRTQDKTGRRGALMRLRRFRSDRRGASLIEFSLVGFPFFLLLFGIIEVGLIFWTTLELENATDDVARMVRTGQAQGGDFDEARLKQEVCNRVTILSDCTTKLRIDVQSFPTAAAMNPPQPVDPGGNMRNNFSLDMGGPQDLVLFSSFYEWPLVSGLTGLGNMANGNRLIRASGAFRNEPFPES